MRTLGKYLGHTFSVQKDIHYLAIPFLSAALMVLALGIGISNALTVSGVIRNQEGQPVKGALVTFINEADDTRSISQITGDDGGYQIDLSSLLYPEVSISEANASEVPARFELFQSYPNPFNPETVILYQTSEASEVYIVVYNNLGQRIRTLVDDDRAPGVYHVRWDARDDNGLGVGAGVYFYQMRAGNFVQTRKMLLLDGSPSAVAPSTAALSPSRGHSKAVTLIPLFSVHVAGEGFFEYWRRGVAVDSDMTLDITVNSTSDQGMLRLSLTDAPTDSADEVNVTISSVEIKRKQSDPWESFGGDPGQGWIRDLAANQVGTTINLLELTGGITTLLGEEPLEPGVITGIRLIVDRANIVMDGESYDLPIPSGAQSGLKLQGHFEIVEGEILDLTLDFDVRKSIVQRGNSKNEFLLKPVIRLVSTPETGSISGRVIAEEGVSIQAVIIAIQDGEEISSAKVHPKDGTYRISYLLAGSYDLQVETREGWIVDPQPMEGVVVASGEETEDIDFTLTAEGGGVETEQIEIEEEQEEEAKGKGKDKEAKDKDKGKKTG